MNERDAAHRLQGILSQLPIAAKTQSIVEAVEEDRVSVRIVANDGGLTRFAGHVLFAAIDVIGSFALWAQTGNLRGLMTTSMSWNCFRPVYGRELLIDAVLLSRSRTTATVQIGLSVGQGAAMRSCAIVTAAVHIRRKRDG